MCNRNMRMVGTFERTYVTCRHMATWRQRASCRGSAATDCCLKLLHGVFVSGWLWCDAHHPGCWVICAFLGPWHDANWLCLAFPRCWADGFRRWDPVQGAAGSCTACRACPESLAATREQWLKSVDVLSTTPSVREGVFPWSQAM